MSSTKAKQLESSIDSARISKDWNTASNLAKRYTKHSNSNTVSGILEEIILAESFFDKDPKQAKSILLKILERDSENEEVLSLLGKLEMQAEDPTSALSYLQKIKVKDPQSYGIYPMRLVLEGLYNRGVCLDKTGKESFKSYSECADLGLSFYENQSSFDFESKIIVENALLKVAESYLHKDNLTKCLESYRKIQNNTLGSTSPQNINKFNRQFAKFLLRHISHSTYETHPPKESISKDEVEEAIIMLLLFEDNSNHSNKEDLTALDDLCLLYSKRFGYSNLVEIYERVVASRMDNKHMWVQFAMTLINSGNTRRALFVLKQCISNDPSNPLLYLLAAKICINNLNESKLAIQYAQSAIQFEGPYEARSYHALGLAYSQLSNQVKSNEERKSYQTKSLEYLIKSFNLDSYDYLCSFHLALQFAEIREVAKALHYVKLSLTANRSNADSWNLLALLLSAQKQYADALITCKAGLQEVNDINLLITRAKLEQILDNTNESLMTLKDAFTLWKQTEQLDKKKKQTNSGNGKIESDRKSMESSVKDFDTDSVERKSIIYTHTMSVYSDPADEKHEHKVGVGRIDLWLIAAELFTDLGQYKDASVCIQEARNLSNLSPEVFLQEGLIEESRQKFDVAMENYEKALAIDSTHKESLIHLAIAYHKQNKLLQAEKALSTVVRNDPTCHEAWYRLGAVLHSKGDYEQASECYITAGALEETAPLLPYTRIKKVLNW